MKKLVIGLILPIILGCGGTESGNPNFFLTASQQVAPVIKESSSTAVTAQVNRSSKAVRSVTDSFSGSILDKIYQALREYEFPRDEGVIDMHNIYKALTQTGQVYETAEQLCNSIPETTVQSPFDLGLSSATYNCAGNSGTLADAYARGFAIRVAGETKHALLTYYGAPDPDSQKGYGILQGDYTESSGALSLRMIHLTTYTAQEGFVVRTHIDGNAKTHAFSLSTISSNLSAGSAWTSLVGNGISRGAGNYFLFKANTSGGVSGAYFCISAEAGLAELQAMHDANPEGKSTVDAECTDLQDDVDAMTFIQQSEVPTAATDFRDSTILLSF